MITYIACYGVGILYAWLSWQDRLQNRPEFRFNMLLAHIWIATATIVITVRGIG